MGNPSSNVSVPVGATHGSVAGTVVAGASVVALVVVAAVAGAVVPGATVGRAVVTGAGAGAAGVVGTVDTAVVPTDDSSSLQATRPTIRVANSDTTPSPSAV
jgi:hypothetical protein